MSNNDKTESIVTDDRDEDDNDDDADDPKSDNNMAISGATTTTTTTTTTNTSKLLTTAPKNKRTTSFTERFRSFSNDFIRSIELAHDYADLRNSNFATATVAAAATQIAQLATSVDLDAPRTTTAMTASTNAVSVEMVPTGDVLTKGQEDQCVDQVDFQIKTPAHNHNKTTGSDNAVDNGVHDECVIPDGIYISIWEVFIYLWGVIAFFIDIVSDIILSIGYYNIDKKWLSFLTMLFVIVPNVTLSLFSLSWYIDNYASGSNSSNGRRIKTTPTDKDDNNKSQFKSGQAQDRHNTSRNKFNFDSIIFWLTTIIFLVFQLDLVYKYIQGFVYTLKGWVYRRFYNNKIWEKYYIEKQIKCDTDIGMLRLIDVFMDSGPQLYVITTQTLNANKPADLLNKELIITTDELTKFTWTNFFTQENRLVLKQIVSISSSLFSMAYALAGYHRCLRNQQFIFSLHHHKPLLKPISWLATIMQFVWYLFLIAPRVFAMALFASTFRSWFFMVILIHWAIMYSWILNFKTNYCITSTNGKYNAREEIFEKFYNFVCSFIYIFAYFNVKIGRTRYRYIIYYVIFYSENCLFSITYYLYTTEKNYNFKFTSLIIILLGFWFAILFQIIYYLNFHPSMSSKLFGTKIKPNKAAQSVNVKINGLRCGDDDGGHSVSGQSVMEINTSTNSSISHLGPNTKL